MVLQHDMTGIELAVLSCNCSRCRVDGLIQNRPLWRCHGPQEGRCEPPNRHVKLFYWRGNPFHERLEMTNWLGHVLIEIRFVIGWLKWLSTPDWWQFISDSGRWFSSWFSDTISFWWPPNWPLATWLSAWIVSITTTIFLRSTRSNFVEFFYDTDERKRII